MFLLLSSLCSIDRIAMQEKIQQVHLSRYEGVME